MSRLPVEMNCGVSQHKIVANGFTETIDGKFAACVKFLGGLFSDL